MDDGSSSIYSQPSMVEPDPQATPSPGATHLSPPELTDAASPQSNESAETLVESGSQSLLLGPENGRPATPIPHYHDNIDTASFTLSHFIENFSLNGEGSEEGNPGGENLEYIEGEQPEGEQHEGEQPERESSEGEYPDGEHPDGELPEAAQPGRSRSRRWSWRHLYQRVARTRLGRRFTANRNARREARAQRRAARDRERFREEVGHRHVTQLYRLAEIRATRQAAREEPVPDPLDLVGEFLPNAEARLSVEAFMDFVRTQVPPWWEDPADAIRRTMRRWRRVSRRWTRRRLHRPYPILFPNGPF
ncbi:hypothetical protein F5Y09DRAFT_353095 [Xylaria sp. FL1042]|nr:hypothetical protein F5Y09DRAFT_353095 [Xylaria sp. FL1042]